MSIERRSPESVEQPSQGALVLFGSSQQQPKGRGYGLVTIREAMNCTCKHRLVGKRLPGAHGPRADLIRVACVACAQCGSIGCCDTSPSQHATAHAQATGHPVIRSFEPGEDWFWNFETKDYAFGPALAPPAHHPVDQPTPGPAGRVPADWERHLH